MKKLFSYIFGQLFFSVLLIGLVLSCIMWLVQTLRYIELIANKGVPILLFLEMVACLFPNIFIITFPIALLLGTLFIYNKLTSDHELIAMQTAGVSPWQLAKPVMALSLVVSIFLYSLTLYFLPFAFRKHRDMVALLKQESLTSLISDGQFSTFKNYTIYARSQDSPGCFSGVLLYDGTSPDKTLFFMAEKGILVNKDGGSCLILLKGNRQEQDKASGKPSVLYFDRYFIDSKNKMFESKKEIRILRAHERSIQTLLNPKEPLNPQLQQQCMVALHQRFIFPLYPVVFGFLGAALLLLGHFNRRGRTGRIVLACLITLGIEVTEMILFHGWGGEFVFWLCYGVVLVPLGICFMLLFPWRLGESLLEGGAL